MVKFILLLGDEASNHAGYSDPKVTFDFHHRINMQTE